MHRTKARKTKTKWVYYRFCTSGIVLLLNNQSKRWEHNIFSEVANQKITSCNIILTVRALLSYVSSYFFGSYYQSNRSEARTVVETVMIFNCSHMKAGLNPAPNYCILRALRRRIQFSHPQHSTTRS
mgnify:CR=1 FL=1